MEVIEIIRELQQKKIDAKMVPNYVLKMDLLRHCKNLGIEREKVEKEVGKLVESGKATKGNSIRDKYVSLI